MADDERQPLAGRGIRLRFTLALAAFMTLAMALLGAFLFLTQRARMLERHAEDVAQVREALLEKGRTYGSFLARIAPQGLLAYDYLLLEGYAEELSADPDVAYAVILGGSGAPVTHVLRRGDAERTLVPPEAFERALAQARQAPDRVAVERPIEQDGVRLGTVEIGLSQARVAESLAELESGLRRELARVTRVTAGAILLSLLVLVVLVATAFERMIASPIRRLGEVMGKAPGGVLGARAEGFRDDEIGWLARCYDRMAESLEGQWRALEDQRRAYKDTRDYLANILDNSADMIVTTGLDGSVVEFNTGAERTLGYARGEVVGRPSRTLFCEVEERARFYAEVREGRLVQDVETRLLRKDGTAIDAQLTLSPLRDNAGGLIGAVCIGRDVTQARALREEVIQAEKLASIGQVASWITHQIRNYLGRIVMDLSLLRPGPDAPEAPRKAHRDLSRAVEEMGRIVTDLLDYSRTLRLHPTPVKLNASLEGLLAGLDAEVGTGVRVERDLAPDLPPIRADVFKLEQAFGNVLNNAIEAMSGAGTLTVATRAGPEPGWVTIRVADSGPGILPEDLPRVMRPFFTTKPAGTGLGLALAARIAAAHGGSLEAETPPGGGAVLTFRLPAGGPEEDRP